MQDFLTRRSPTSFVPLPRDLIDYPDIKLVMNLGIDAWIPASAYADILPCLIDRRVAESESSLRALSTAALQEDISSDARRSPRHANPECLNLARTLFQCRKCSRVLHSREALEHSCLYEATSDWNRTADDFPTINGKIPCIKGDIFENAVALYHRGRKAWSASALDYQGIVAASVITMCGKNPHAAGIEELNRCATRLMCLRCSKSNRRALILDWRAAVSDTITGLLVDSELTSTTD